MSWTRADEATCVSVRPAEGFYLRDKCLLFSQLDFVKPVEKRHDSTKVGYVRPKDSKLSDGDLHKIFDGISFLTRQTGERTIPRSELRGFVEHASKLAGIPSNSDAVINDIAKLTCLIVETGGDYTFIHRQIQEFHAACFIKSRPEIAGKEFYSRCSSNTSYQASWATELGFLSEMDFYRFTKFYAIPTLGHLLSGNDNEILQRIFAEITIDQRRNSWEISFSLPFITAFTPPINLTRGDN